MSVGSAPHFPRTESNVKDVDPSVEQTYVVLEPGLPTDATMASSSGDRHNPATPPTTGSTVAATDTPSVYSETSEAKTDSDIYESVTSPHSLSESQPTHPSVQPPAHLAVYHPNATDSGEGTSDVLNCTDCGGISFDLTMLKGAVLSLLEGQSHSQGECLWLLHDMTFDNTTVNVEFVELD
jgi:hypothetical protein